MKHATRRLCSRTAGRERRECPRSAQLPLGRLKKAVCGCQGARRVRLRCGQLGAAEAEHGDDRSGSARRVCPARHVIDALSPKRRRSSRPPAARLFPLAAPPQP